MAQINNLLLEQAKIDLVAPPDSYAASANTSAWVDMRGYERTTFLIGLKAGVAQTVAVKIQRAADDSGTDAEDITGLTGSFAAGDGDSYGAISVEQSDATNDLPYVAVVITPDTSAQEMDAYAIRTTSYTEPVDNSNEAVFDVSSLTS